MKVLHTSDWHLGQTLYGYSRQEEETYFWEQLGIAVREEQPDAMLVSGDIFHTGTPGNEVARTYTDRLLSICKECPTMDVVVIAGNHDSYSRLIVDQALWKEFRVHIVGTPAEDENGFADFSKTIVDIHGKGLVAAVPFCCERNFPHVEGIGSDDYQQAYFAGLQSYVNTINTNHLPVVLMAHLTAGSNLDITGHDSASIYGGLESVELSTLGCDYDYIALGHIHCPQWLNGEKKYARYCGTPRQIHFDEEYSHGIDIVNVTAGELPRVTTRTLPPLIEMVTIGGKDGLPFEEALDEFARLESFPEKAYVRINVKLAPNEIMGADWTDRARTLVEGRGGQFCLLNPKRETTHEDVAPEVNALSMTELKEMNSDELFRILTIGNSLNERQAQLLQNVIKSVIEENV